MISLMAKVAPDYSFKRDGKDLSELLWDLVGTDAQARNIAGELIHGMSWGIPSANTDLADLEPFPNTTAQGDRFNGAVRDRVNKMGDRRAAWVCQLLLMKQLIKKDWLQTAKSLSINNQALTAQEDTLLEKSLTADDPQEQEQAMKRYIRLFCAGCARDNKLTNQALMNQPFAMASEDVYRALGTELYDGKAILLDWLSTRSQRPAALEAIRRIGLVGRVFIEPLTNGLKQTETDWFDGGLALAACGKGDPGLADSLLGCIRSGQQGQRNAALHVLAEIGNDLAGREDAMIDAVKALLEDESQRFRAIGALGSIGRDRDDCIDLIIPYLEQTLPEGPGSKDYHVHREMVEIAAAIGALSHSTRSAQRIVPRLIEAFDRFEEYDPDETYRGEHERICEALSKFGKDAAPALRWIEDYLEAWLQKPQAERETPQDVFGLLASIGGEAIGLAPLLQRIAVECGGGDDDDAFLDHTGSPKKLIAHIKADSAKPR